MCDCHVKVIRFSELSCATAAKVWTAERPPDNSTVVHYVFQGPAYGTHPDTRLCNTEVVTNWDKRPYRCSCSLSSTNIKQQLSCLLPPFLSQLEGHRYWVMHASSGACPLGIWDRFFFAVCWRWQKPPPPHTSPSLRLLEWYWPASLLKYHLMD